MTTHYIDGTLTLDLEQGYCECPARYRIEADWKRGKLLCWRSVSLDAFSLGSFSHPRSVAMGIIGQNELTRQERLAAERWAEMAEYDAAMERGEDRDALAG